MKVLLIGIASTAVFRARTIAIAKGRVKPKAGEPKIWFSSAQSIGKLIDDNWSLLQETRRRPPRAQVALRVNLGRSRVQAAHQIGPVQQSSRSRSDQDNRGNLGTHTRVEGLRLKFGFDIALLNSLQFGLIQ
jgi:hypothetical protein